MTGERLWVLLVLETRLAAAVVLIAASFALGAVAAAPARVAITLSAPSHLWLEGDSPLRRYRLTTTDLRVTFDLDAEHGPAPYDIERLLLGPGIRAMRITIPVASLHSNSPMLDDQVRTALAAGVHPLIVAELDAHDVLAPSVPGAAFSLGLRGTLTVAGMTRPIELVAAAFREAGSLRLAGTLDLSMRHHGVSPPSPWLGALRPADSVRVGFEIRTPRRGLVTTRGGVDAAACNAPPTVGLLCSAAE
jgi:hypothetical protein